MRVVPTEYQAAETLRTFHDREPRRHTDLHFSWPKTMHEVGIGRAELYRSNKWKANPRDFEEYKHVVEGDRTLLVTPGFIRDYWTPTRKIPTVGPTVELLGPFPGHITVLGPLLGLQMQLYDEVDEQGEPHGRRPFEMRIAHATLAAGKHPETREVFLCVYDRHGVHVLLTGSTLSIEKDGIAG